MTSQLWKMAVVGLAVGIGDSKTDGTERPQRANRQPAAVNYHMLLAEPSQHSRHHMFASSPTQPGVFGVSREYPRGRAPAASISTPLGERLNMAAAIGLMPVAIRPDAGVTGIAVMPMAYSDNQIAGPAMHAPSVVAAQTNRVSILIDTGHDGRIRILGLLTDNTQAFEAYADRILFDPSESGRVEIAGAVEIQSRQANQPARVLAARAIVNLNDGSVEVLPGHDR